MSNNNEIKLFSQMVLKAGQVEREKQKKGLTMVSYWHKDEEPQAVEPRYIIS